VKIMGDEKEIKPFRGLTPAEEAEYHLANADRYAEYMETATPIQLDRVVSTRFASEELEQIKTAASTAGISVSEFIRRATVAYLAPARDAAEKEPAVPASAVIDLLGDYGITINELQVTPKRRRQGKVSEIRKWAKKNHIVLREAEAAEDSPGSQAADA
jgi:predicted DNA binding CopG/RHH family protein